MITTDKSTALKKIQNQISIIDSINPVELESNIFKDWKHTTIIVIDNVFGNSSRQLKLFEEIKYRPAIRLFSSRQNDQTPLQVQRFKEGLDNARAILNSFIKEIEEYWVDSNPATSSVGINEVVDLKPNIFGFGLNINTLIKKYFSKR